MTVCKFCVIQLLTKKVVSIASSNVDLTYITMKNITMKMACCNIRKVSYSGYLVLSNNRITELQGNLFHSQSWINLLQLQLNCIPITSLLESLLQYEVFANLKCLYLNDNQIHVTYLFLRWLILLKNVCSLRQKA